MGRGRRPVRGASRCAPLDVLIEQDALLGGARRLGGLRLGRLGGGEELEAGADRGGEEVDREGVLPGRVQEGGLPLERIRDAKGVSKDVLEIASRSLEG